MHANTEMAIGYTEFWRLRLFYWH